ncbi:arginase-2, mitochondrial [Solea senegalensis]|uniref:Arginase n=1 Tax=Solea senegalensis TaxID=28829 RepID=A0AAV6S2E9_SOLSE|nr:arginase-2, mitochondrial [Solea senegalensis]KAG7510542.1 arginase-2, mitochondrial [Solea senegalensis]
MSLRGQVSRLLRNLLSRVHTQQSRAQSVAVLGAPFSRGQKRRGLEHGPKVIREAGLIERLSGLDYSVHDFGDLNFHHPEKDEPYMEVNSPRTVGAANKALSGAVSRAIGAGHTLVMLGGDHSLAIGSVSGHAQQCPDLCLIWVDAHADINTPMTSPSGNLHGQPVAFMLKELQDKMPALPGFSWLKPFLSARDLVYIGLRDVDPGEYHLLKNLGVQYFTMRDIDRLGIQRVMEATFDHLMARKQRPIHLSFDIDAFDPSLAPATGTPVNGGLTYREGIYLTEEIHNTGLLSAMDLVEVNPVLGANPEAVDATASLAVDVIASSLGQTREGAHVSIDEIPVAKDDTEQLRL